MKREDFEFNISNLNPCSIENNICNYCNIGYANTSNINKDMYQNAYIHASEGNVSCHIIVCETKDKKYNIKVSSIDVKKNRKTFR